MRLDDYYTSAVRRLRRTKKDISSRWILRRSSRLARTPCKNDNQVLIPFKLCTVFLEVANLVNLRPIGRIPNDPDNSKFMPDDIFLGHASSERKGKERNFI